MISRPEKVLPKKQRDELHDYLSGLATATAVAAAAQQEVKRSRSLAKHALEQDKWQFDLFKGEAVYALYIGGHDEVYLDRPIPLPPAYYQIRQLRELPHLKPFKQNVEVVLLRPHIVNLVDMYGVRVDDLQPATLAEANTFERQRQVQ